MGHKTFISYKYSDIVKGHENDNLRDRIITGLGPDADLYKGENGFSEDLSSESARTIKEYLKPKIADSTVTIIILSPNMKKSEWMEWEISYSLSEITRNDRTSHCNGAVAVVKKEFPSFDPYGWFETYYRHWDLKKTFGLIAENMNNKIYYNNWDYYRYYNLSKNYIDIIKEDDFLANPRKYIDEAYEKSQAPVYNIRKRPI